MTIHQFPQIGIYQPPPCDSEETPRDMRIESGPTPFAWTAAIVIGFWLLLTAVMFL